MSRGAPTQDVLTCSLTWDYRRVVIPQSSIDDTFQCSRCLELEHEDSSALSVELDEARVVSTLPWRVAAGASLVLHPAGRLSLKFVVDQ